MTTYVDKRIRTEKPPQKARNLQILVVVQINIIVAVTALTQIALKSRRY